MSIKHALLPLVVTFALLAPGATVAPPARPALLGVAKITIRATDIERTAGFYRDLLGFEEADRVGNARRFRINERQSVEVVPGLDPAQDRLVSVSLQTDRAEAMRRYLNRQGRQGWTVAPAVERDPLGNLVLKVRDPAGRQLEFIEYPAGGRIEKDRARPAAAARISARMMHAGVIVTDVPPALRFYGETLGLREFWRGSGRDSKYLSWINMRLPESEDYLELMLYPEDPPGDRRGSAHHLCLEVPNIELARQTIEQRRARVGYTRPIEVRTGVNRRRQLNLFDPDGTRSELMEPRTFDGVPPVSSTLPYPQR